MLARTALLLAVATTFVLAQRQPQQFCDGQKMAHCTASLNTYWGDNSDMTNFWKASKEFVRIITNQYKLNYTTDGYVKVCNGMSLLYYCMGKTNLDLCLGVTGLSFSGLDGYEAYQYDGILSKLRFECGDAIYPVVGNPDFARCVQSTKVNQYQALDSAYDTYLANIQHDTYDMMCSHAQDLISSVTAVFDQGPCRTFDRGIAGWFGCEGARQHVLVQFRHCEHQLRCGRERMFANELPETFRKNAAGALEYLVRPRLYRNDAGELLKTEPKWLPFETSE